MIDNHDDRGVGGPPSGVPSPLVELMTGVSTTGALPSVTVYDEVTFVVDWAISDEQFDSSWFD